MRSEGYQRFSSAAASAEAPGVRAEQVERAAGGLAERGHSPDPVRAGHAVGHGQPDRLGRQPDAVAVAVDEVGREQRLADLRDVERLVDHVRVHVGDALALPALGPGDDAPQEVGGRRGLDRQVEEAARVVRGHGLPVGRGGRPAVACGRRAQAAGSRPNGTSRGSTRRRRAITRPLAARAAREAGGVGVSAQQVPLAQQRVAEREHLVARDARQVARERGERVVLEHHQVAVPELDPAIRLGHRRPTRRPVGTDMVGDRPGLIGAAASP